MTTRTGYGKRVIGEDAFKREQQAEATGESRYGPRVTNPNWPNDPPVAVLEPPKPTNGKPKGSEVEVLTLEDLRLALQNDPASVEEHLTLEEQRSTPRKGALTLMLEAELGRAGGARAEIQERIEAARARIAE